MKKLVLIASLFFAFASNMNAQEAKKSEDRNTANMSKEELIKTQAVNAIDQLDNMVSLNSDLKSNLTQLLFMREEAMNNSKSVEERKAIFTKYGQKLIGGLSEEQKRTLQAKNPELFKKLTVFQE